MKVTSSGKFFKTAFHNDSYLLSFGKRKLQSFDISCE